MRSQPKAAYPPPCHELDLKALATFLTQRFLTQREQSYFNRLRDAVSIDELQAQQRIERLTQFLSTKDLASR